MTDQKFNIQDEDKKYYLDFILNEYSQLRTEQRDVINRQFLIISWTVTLLATLFGLSMKINPPVSVIQNALFYVLIPCGSAFMGIFWADHLYRQIRLGTYISDIEDKINEALSCAENCQPKAALYWEHYLKNQKNDKGIFKRISTNRWVHYFGLLMYVAFPIASVVYIWFFLQRFSWLFVFSVISFLCFLGSGFKYLYEINKLDKNQTKVESEEYA